MRGQLRENPSLLTQSVMPQNRSVDSSLPDWSELEAAHGWSGILVGNGASRAVWDDFKYQSLYQTATSGGVEHPLTEADRHIFQEMATINFEQVLAGLATARIVCDALGIDSALIRERYTSIQRALFEAVSSVHVPWSTETAGTYAIIRRALLPYEYVYSTNYDLISYWAVMAEGGAGFKDYFWEEVFDITDTEIWGKVTKILYLHGGIHLARLPSGSTIKRRAREFQNLLQSLGIEGVDGAIPLFITEGQPKDKLSSIYRSDYLSFAFQRFTKHEGPLVVFGQSLGDADQHLVSAMKSWGSRRIAVSIFPTDDHEIVEFKAKLKRRLPDADLLFFDSTTHPLGSPDLRIERHIEPTADQDYPF